jgi:hypothetical protein
MSETQEYTIRTQGNRAYTYGLGQIVSPGVALFKSGHYNLTKDELARELKKLGQVVIR